MRDLLVRDVDPELYERIKKSAEKHGKSLAQEAREALAQIYRPSRDAMWAEIDRFREQVGPVSSDSTADIRTDRDSR